MDWEAETLLRTMVANCPDNADEHCHCDVYRCGDVKRLLGEIAVLRRQLAEYVISEEA